MNALVFGGTRYLGHQIVAELRKRGHEVAIVDFENPDPDADPIVPSSGIPLTVIPRDALSNPDTIEIGSVATGLDAVFFCGLDPYADDADSPSLGPERLAEKTVLARLLALEPGVLVLTSSAAVYGFVTGRAVLDEGASPLADGGTAAGKHAAELEEIVRAAAGAAVILRCANIVGSGPVPASWGRSPKFQHILPGVRATRVLHPEVDAEVCDPPDAMQVGDFLSITDAAIAHVSAAEWALGQPRETRVFNVGSGALPEPGELAEAVSQIDNLALSGADIESGSAVDRAVLDTGAFQRATGWEPATPARLALGSEASFFRGSLLYRMKIGLDARAGHEFLGSQLTRNGLMLWGLLIVRDKTGMLTNSELAFELNKKAYTGQVFTRRGIRIPFKKVRVSPYLLRIPRADLEGLSLQNPLRLMYVAPDGRWFRRRLRYSFLRGEPDHRRGRLFHFAESDSVIFARQTDEGRVNITVRARNVTDGLMMGLKIRAASLAARLLPRRTVLLYEKEARRYEESAAVVFEAMVDRGRKDAVFILAPECIHEVPERYRAQVVPRFSFSHFYHFFCAQTFIGTETPFSAAELRSSDRLLMRRISRHRYRFVFLQHGVMYMVALSSRQRAFFRAGVVFPLGTKIVTSSQREARHFTDLGGFSAEDLYVSGLPKFDHAVRDPGADRILIMPTWRPWEHNTIRSDPTGVPYYRMVHEMYDAVPEELRDRVYILPHPLVRDVLAQTDLKDRMWDGSSYDAALRQCSVLITDYSSIAYDAFYRGANVVFWWKEMEYCMQQYGGHLMIDEATAFGPVCYDSPALTRAVASSHLAPQDPEFVRRYREIVEFDDNRNTERLLEFMERDGLI